MANCGSNVFILKSIEDLRTRKKRPDQDSVTIHAQKHYGLSIEDSQESLRCLLENGSIVNKPTSTGLASFFIMDGSNNVVPDSSQEDGDQQNDSFLCSMGSVETLTKEQSHQSPLVTIIEKLSDNITMLTNLLNTERTKNTNLLNENINLKIDMEKQRATVQGGFPYSPSTTINSEKLQPLKVDQRALQEKEISHASCQMASTIDTLSNSLQMERSKSDKLLLENFEIKVRNKDLECEIQRLLCSPNTKRPLSESNNIENRTNSVTGARTTSPVTSNNIAHPRNITSTSKQRITPTKTQQMQGPSANANATKNNTRKRRGAKENQQITNKSQTTRKNGAETKSQMEKKVKVLIVGDSNLRNVKEEKLTNDRRNIIVRFKPGMKIEEANKKVGSNTEFDVIIVHAGTNNLRNSKPKDLTETVVNTLDKIFGINFNKGLRNQIMQQGIVKIYKFPGLTLNMRKRAINTLL